MNDGGSAFPQFNENWSHGRGRYIENTGGMSLRQWYAGMALTDEKTWQHTPGMRAELAFGVADAMLSRGEKPPYAKQLLEKLRSKIFKRSDLQDNMDHWLKMQEWCDDIKEIEELL